MLSFYFPPAVESIPALNCLQQDLWSILGNWAMILAETLVLNISNVFFRCFEHRRPIAESLCLIISKTLQLTPKQSRLIKITIGKRKNMLLFFLNFGLNCLFQMPLCSVNQLIIQ